MIPKCQDHIIEFKKKVVVHTGKPGKMKRLSIRRTTLMAFAVTKTKPMIARVAIKKLTELSPVARAVLV